MKMVQLRISPRGKEDRRNVRVLRAISLALAAACFVWGVAFHPTSEQNDSSLALVGTEKQAQQSPMIATEPSRLRVQVPAHHIQQYSNPWDNFIVAGVDLNLYIPGQTLEKQTTTEAPFELFEDFDIASQLKGDENWHHLRKHVRRELERPSLAFYIDKVAVKRWLPSVGIAAPKSYILNYKSELTVSGKVEDERRVLFDLLPDKGIDYCAKPTHTSCSVGVWLVKNARLNGKIVQYLSQTGSSFKDEPKEYVTDTISTGLAKSLHEPALGMESWALKQVKHGVVVEERITSFDRDDRPALEFKVFCIWGRFFVSYWKQGTYHYGLFQRDGTKVKGPDNEGSRAEIERPKWVDWDAVVDLAEKLAANKDMIRVDIFVGRSGGLEAGKQTMKPEIFLSEMEIHPTTVLRDMGILDQAARLWVAGYKIGNYRIVPNTEVPTAFLKTGMLSVEDAQQLLVSNATELPADTY